MESKKYEKKSWVNFNVKQKLELIKNLECGAHNKSQQDTLFVNFILIKNATCFGQTYCPLSRVLILYSQ
jgi:hypothetical protein